MTFRLMRTLDSNSTAMNPIFFDIETGPLPDEELASLIPPFDPDAVKVGNLKDPEKIAAKRMEAEANHAAEFIERAALDALTGRVLAIGILVQPGGFVALDSPNEAVLLDDFWECCRGEQGRINRMVGFNIHLFDLPFLIRRSWKHQVPVPLGIRRGRFWGEEMVDLREAWQLGDKHAHGSLDAIARHLGIGAKNGEGKDFARLWATDRPQALAYLQQDLELTAQIAERLGLGL